MRDGLSRCSQHWQVVNGGYTRAGSYMEVSNVQFDAQGRLVLFTTSDGRTMAYNTPGSELCRSRAACH